MPDAKRSAAAKKAAKTRADNKLKNQLSIDDEKVEKLKAKHAAKGDTPEARKKAARDAKIAEIKKKEANEAKKKKAKRSAAAVKANQTKLNVKLYKLVGKIRKASDEEAVKLLRDLIGK